MSDYYEENNEQYINEENVPKIDFTCREGKAMQLVQLREKTNDFAIVEETVEYLKQFEGGVAVCSIVGRYRTGKSFLMNKLLDLDNEKGFQVSPNVDACTKVAI
jgi:tRNA U34 5-carboxymethylaminomethyl modifying GTPase MnmE/TrmE